MTDSAGRSSRLHKHLWRAPQPTEARSRLVLFGQRLLFLAVTFALLAGFVLSITSIYRQPRTHLFLFEDQIPDYRVRENLIAFPPLPYPHNAADLFKELISAEPAKGETAPAPRSRRHAVAQLQDLGDTIQSEIRAGHLRHHDVAIIYVRAQGLVIDGDPVLLTHTGNPRNPMSRISVSELLDSLNIRTNATLLLLDYGNLEADVATGVMANPFPDALQKLLNSRDQPNLWVVTSHGLFEASYVSDANARTVFEAVASLGLAGAADQNQDGWVLTSEFLSYLKQQVAQRIRITSEGMLEQTVRVFRTAEPVPPHLTRRLISSPTTKADTQQESTPATPATPAAPAQVAPTETKQGSLWPNRMSLPLAHYWQQTPATTTSNTATPAAVGTNSPTPATQANAPADEAAKPATNTTSTTNAQSNTAPAVPEDADDAMQAAKKLRQQTQPLTGTLQDCWTIYDQLRELPEENAITGTALPLSCYAPTAWKELEAVLVHATMLAERPGVANESALQELLNSEVMPLAEFQFDRPLPAGKGLALRLDSAVPRGELSWPDPRSVDIPNWVASIGHKPLDQPLQQQLDQFDELMEESTSEELSKWLASQAEFVADYDEAALAQQMLTANISWPVCQAAVMAKRLSVRSRLTLYAENAYVQDLIGQGDELLSYGRLLIADRTESDTKPEALRSFSLATERYQRAINFCAQLADLQRDVWHCSVDANAVRFLRQTTALRARTQPPPTETEALARLASLQTFLNNALHATPAGLYVKQAELLSLRSLSPWDVNEAEDSAPDEFLLSAPLSLVARARLAEKESSKPSKSRNQPILPDTEFTVETASELMSAPTRPREAWQPAWERAERAYQKCQLAVALWGRDTPEFERLESQYTSLKQTYEQPSDNAEPISGDLFDQYGDAVAAFLRSQYDPEQLPSAESARTPGRHLRYPFVLRNEFGPTAARMSTTQLNHHFWIRTVETAANALRTLQTEPRVFTPQELRTRQQRVNEIRPTVSGQPLILPVPTRPLPVQAEQQAPAPLLGGSEATFAIDLISLQSRDLKVWLAADLDPTALQLDWIQSDDSTVPVPRWHNSRPLVSAVADLPTYRPLSKVIAELSAANTGLDLPAGGQRTLRFRITRLDPQAKDLACYLHVAGYGRVLRIPLDIQTGPIEPITLALTADTAEVDRFQRGWKVQLRPDTPAHFQLLADNGSDADQQVAVSVFAYPQIPADLPYAAVDATTGRNLLQAWGNAPVQLQVDNVKIAGNAEQSPLTANTPAAPAPKAPANAASKGPVTGQPAASQSTAPAVPAIPPALVVVLQNQTGGQYTFLPLEVEVTHPREYVMPGIDYTSSSRTLSLRFERDTDDVTVPTPIEVTATVAFEGETDLPAKFPITIAADQQQSQFQTQLPPSDGKDLLVELTIDGYPRAFRYRVPTDRTSRNLPTTGEPQLEILLPPTDSAYGNDTQTIPVALQADLGVGGGQDSSAFLEFGIDINRDRDLYQDPSVRIPQDRLPRLYSMGDTSQLALRGVVDDLSLIVPIDTLANRRVNLIGRIHSGTNDVWSLPVEIILDSDPPRVLSLDPLAGAVMGKPLPVSLTADDGDLSGVASVEVALDTTGAGDFSPAVKPTQAKQNDLGEWTADVPTVVPQPGGYLLLARATDRAGNVSSTFRMLVNVISAEQETEMQNAPVKVIRGVVTYGKQPVAGATATLVDDKGKQVGVGTSDDGGRFVIDHIRPGKYKLQIRAVERGKIRNVEQDIELTPDSPEVNDVFALP